MKNEILFFLLLSGISALAADSLNCSMVDWLDAPSGHNFNHYGTSTYYEYSGTKFWDLAMGDSFLVWLPGSDRILFLDSYDSTDVDTIANFDYGSVDAVGVTICDSIIYLVGGGAVNTTRFRNDSLILKDQVWTAFTSYHFAALEDSFLYTVTPGALTCINVADPESIFIYRTCAPAGCNCGLEVVDGYAYTLTAGSHCDEYDHAWPVIIKEKYDMINSAVADRTESIWEAYISLGDLAADDEFVYYVSSEMDGPLGWTIGESDLFVYGTDTTYNFDSRWDGQGVFGVDVLGDYLIAAGFEHGFSVLNISDLADIHEVAYYIDCNSTMDLTHFALKENRLYAMGHPRNSWVRLYMFELEDSVVMAIDDHPLAARPGALAISAYPNPFNSAVTISLTCHSRENGNPEDYQIEIFDINGRRVDVIARRATPDEAISPQTEGDCRALRARNDGADFIWQPDESLGSGVYLVRARFGACETSRRIVYLK